jgi:hypothetical protein
MDVIFQFKDPIFRQYCFLQGIVYCWLGTDCFAKHLEQAIWGLCCLWPHSSSDPMSIDPKQRVIDELSISYRCIIDVVST